MIWITRDREFIDDSQQQNGKDFVIGLQNGLPVCRTTNLVGQIYKPCHHDITTAKPSFRTAIAMTLRTNPSSGQPKLQTLATHNQMQNSSSGSFTMPAMNHLKIQLIFHETLITLASSKQIGWTSKKFEFQNLGFWLSNFDKSWIAELT